MTVKRNSWKYLGLISHIGLTIVFSVLIGAALGYYLDGLLGTRVVFTLLLIVVGSASGMWNAYNLLIKISVDDLDK